MICSFQSETGNLNTIIQPVTLTVMLIGGVPMEQKRNPPKRV
ncbi:hypothetical protein REJC140_03446 [Pseudorhizobium endolithicum]|uniref:Uncharacterized protein n=1 Tax=Pseudorhizobium endolithicum TaxID=1191678 RepID=A0ABM8PKZ6_9HYPH|nr:hypothetical protein REJC140_03446 [Pseudorhizobium endolithicum]